LKKKLLNLLLIITSLLGYMEWGGGNHTFVFQAESEIFTKLVSDPVSVLHPFIVLPLLGQLLLVITLFQRTPGKILTYTGIVCLGMLMVFLFAIGSLAGNSKMIFYPLPFIVVATLSIVQYRNKGNNYRTQR
jgi:hypothetical protein